VHIGSPKNFKVRTEREKKLTKASETMKAQLCNARNLKRPTTGKDDDDDDDKNLTLNVDCTGPPSR
jgi:hypothetical protein